MNYSIKDLTGFKTAIHCKTEEESDQVRKLLHTHGYKWSTGKSLINTKNEWSEYKEEFTYNIQSWTDKQGIMFGYVKWCQANNYTRIIFAEDFIKDNQIEKPKNFSIQGAPNLVKAFWKELKEVGYIHHASWDEDSEQNTYQVISNNRDNDHLKTLDEYKVIFISTSSYSGYNGSNEKFHLPKQWNEALEYVKNAYNSPYWKIQEQKKDIYIGEYKAEYNPGVVSFGCQSFTKDRISAYRELLQRSAFTTSLKINNVDITIEMLTEILKNI